MGGDHKCPVCQATFTRPQHVARHMRSHTGDRPYKCQYCGDQFARSDLLSRHINKCHANERPLPSSSSRRKGSASASRATTSKQACDQCVQSSLPCDGSNPCGKCIQRKTRCTFVKFHRQTAPVGPGHNPNPNLRLPPSSSSLPSVASLGQDSSPAMNSLASGSSPTLMDGVSVLPVPLSASGRYGGGEGEYLPLGLTTGHHLHQTHGHSVHQNQQQAHQPTMAESLSSYSGPGGAGSFSFANLYPQPQGHSHSHSQSTGSTVHSQLGMDREEQEQQQYVGQMPVPVPVHQTHIGMGVGGVDVDKYRGVPVYTSERMEYEREPQQHQQNDDFQEYQTHSRNGSRYQPYANAYDYASAPPGSTPSAGAGSSAGDASGYASYARANAGRDPYDGYDTYEGYEGYEGYDRSLVRGRALSLSEKRRERYSKDSLRDREPEHATRPRTLSIATNGSSASRSTSYSPLPRSQSQLGEVDDRNSPVAPHSASGAMAHSLSAPTAAASISTSTNPSTSISTSTASPNLAPSPGANPSAFSSAFGLMSLDDPNVLAGLAADGAPFFSDVSYGAMPGTGVGTLSGLSGMGLNAMNLETLNAMGIGNGSGLTPLAMGMNVMPMPLSDAVRIDTGVLVDHQSPYQRRRDHDEEAPSSSASSMSAVSRNTSINSGNSSRGAALSTTSNSNSGGMNSDPDATPMPIREAACTSGFGQAFQHQQGQLRRPASSSAVYGYSGSDFGAGGGGGGGEAMVMGMGTPGKDADTKALGDFWKQYMRTPLTGPGGGFGVGGESSGSAPSQGAGHHPNSHSGTTPYRRPRVASLPSSQSTPSGHGQGLGPTSSLRTTLHAQYRQNSKQQRNAGGVGMPVAMGTGLMDNEDLRSYEAAVLARKAPTNLNLGGLQRAMTRRGRGRSTLGPRGGAGAKKSGTLSASASPEVEFAHMQGGIPGSGVLRSGDDGKRPGSAVSNSSTSTSTSTSSGAGAGTGNIGDLASTSGSTLTSLSRAFGGMGAHLSSPSPFVIRDLVAHQRGAGSDDSGSGSLSASPSNPSRASSVSGDAEHDHAVEGGREGSAEGSVSGHEGVSLLKPRPSFKRLASQVLESSNPKARRFSLAGGEEGDLRDGDEVPSYEEMDQQRRQDHLGVQPGDARVLASRRKSLLGPLMPNPTATAGSPSVSSLPRTGSGTNLGMGLAERRMAQLSWLNGLNPPSSTSPIGGREGNVHPPGRTEGGGERL